MSSAQYALLGLHPRNNPSERDITKAYRSLSLRYHPDKAPNDPHAARKFCALNDAYEAVKARTVHIQAAEARRTAAEAKVREDDRKAREFAEFQRQQREAQRLEAERVKREKREREKSERERLEREKRQREKFEKARLEREKRERIERKRIAAEQREKKRLADNWRNFQKATSKFTEQMKTENKAFSGGYEFASRGLNFADLYAYGGTGTTGTSEYLGAFASGLRGLDFGDLFATGSVSDNPRLTGVITAGGKGPGFASSHAPSGTRRVSGFGGHSTHDSSFSSHVLRNFSAQQHPMNTPLFTQFPQPSVNLDSHNPRDPFNYHQHAVSSPPFAPSAQTAANFPYGQRFTNPFQTKEKYSPDEAMEDVADATQGNSNSAYQEQYADQRDAKRACDGDMEDVIYYS